MVRVKLQDSKMRLLQREMPGDLQNVFYQLSLQIWRCLPTVNLSVDGTVDLLLNY